MVLESRMLRGTFGAMRAEQTGHDEELGLYTFCYMPPYLAV
jgi:hypothetical protein